VNMSKNDFRKQGVRKGIADSSKSSPGTMFKN